MNSQPPETPSPWLSEWEWEQLVGLLCDGQVVPICGPELLLTESGGKQEFLYDVWGRAVAESAGVKYDFDGSLPALYQITNYLLTTPNPRVKIPRDLAYLLDLVIQRTPWPIPAPLKQLAEIDCLPLLITTTIDHLLRNALQEAGTGPVVEIPFIPRGEKNQIDLPEHFSGDTERTVFQLFGAANRSPNTFAATEDDLIAFSWSLLDRQYTPDRLYDYINGKTVLLVGCSFPDWLGRFFIHALQGLQRDIAFYYVSARKEPGLADYLVRKKATVLVPCDPVPFVAELHRRWNAARKPDAAVPARRQPSANLPSIKRGAVFISYAREDRAVARAIRDQLEKEEIDTWMDESALQGGDHWEYVIEDRIRDSAFFLAVISRHLDPEVYGGGERFFLREWHLAMVSKTKRGVNEKFLLPVSVDGTRSTAPFARVFQDSNWEYLDGDRLGETLIEEMRKGIRNFRRTKP